MDQYMQNQVWFIIYNTEILLNKNNLFPNEKEVQCIFNDFIRYFLLGTYNNQEYYCAEIIHKNNYTNKFHTVSFRQALSLVYPDEYAMAVKALSIINWDKNHQFCGRCGKNTVYQDNKFERTCLFCKIHFYPRISPSIIVLIYKGDHLVMARSPHFQPGVYALIAGFVEAGENVEEAVHREVKEEIGLEIKNLSYFGSQPWPFPDSLMLAFIAEYQSGDIVIDTNEIEEAGWYKFDNLPGRPSNSISIASKLIDYFIKHCQESQKKSPHYLK